MKHELIELNRILQFSSGFYYVKDFDNDRVTLAKLEDFDQCYPRTMVIYHTVLKLMTFKTVGYANSHV